MHINLLNYAKMHYIIGAILALCSVVFFLRRHRREKVSFFYIEPKKIEHAKNRLRKGICILTGDYGIGKSYSAAFLSEWAKEELGAKTVIRMDETFPIFWQRIKDAKNACLIIDDFLGKDVFCPYNLRFLKELKTFASLNYLILTQDEHFLNQAMEYIENEGLKEHIIKLDAEDYSKEALLKIFNYHGGRDKKYLASSKDVLSPLICKIAAKIKNEEERKAFLKNPHDTLKEWLKKIEKSPFLHSILTRSLFILWEEGVEERAKHYLPKLCFQPSSFPYLELDALFYKVAREWAKGHKGALLMLLPSFEELAKDIEPKTRYNVCNAMKIFAECAQKRVISLLFELSKDRVECIRWSAINALSTLNLAAEHILPEFEKLFMDEDTKEAATFFLKNFAERAPHVALEIAKEWAKKDGLEEASIVLCSKLPKELSEEAMKILETFSRVKKKEVKKALSIAIGEIGVKQPESATRILRHLLQEEGLEKEIASSIAKMSKGRKNETFSLLQELSLDKSPNIRWMVAHTLRYLLGQDPQTSFTLLSHLAEDEDIAVKKESLRTLSFCAEYLPEKVLEKFSSYFNDKDVEEVLLKGVEEIGRKRPNETLEYVRRWILRKESFFQLASAKALAGIAESKAKEVLHLLPTLLKNEDIQIRECACHVLANIGRECEEEVFLLLDEFAQKEEKVFHEACAMTLKELAKSIPKKVFSLIEKWENVQDWQTQRTLVLSMEQIAKVKPHQVFEIVEAWAKSPDTNLRHIAAMALAEVGKIELEKACSILRRLSKEGERRVRFAAADSLHRIIKAQKLWYDRQFV